MRQDLKDKYSERLGVNTRNDASRANGASNPNGANWKDNPFPACLAIVVGHLFFGLMSYLLWRFNR
jgi:hypothetical protein